MGNIQHCWAQCHEVYAFVRQILKRLMGTSFHTGMYLQEFMEFSVYDPAKIWGYKEEINKWLTWPFNWTMWWPIVAFIVRNSVQREETVLLFHTLHQRIETGEQRSMESFMFNYCTSNLLQAKSMMQYSAVSLLPLLSVSVAHFYLCQNSKWLDTYTLDCRGMAA